MIETERPYTGTKQETKNRAFNSLMHVAQLDVTKAIHYEGKNAKGEAEYHTLEPKELANIRNHVEAKLGATYVRNGGGWQEVNEVVKRGREIAPKADNVVRLKARL